MNARLSKEDLEIIFESLKYTKLKFEDYQEYPSYEYKRKRIKEVQDVMVKVKNIIDRLKQ